MEQDHLKFILINYKNTDEKTFNLIYNSLYNCKKTIEFSKKYICINSTTVIWKKAEIKL